MNTSVRTIIVNVSRGTSDDGSFQKYHVDIEGTMSVMQVLNEIHEKIDPSLAFYASCRLGKCGSCKVKVDGKLCLSCTTPVEGDFTVVPDPSGRLIRDLLVVWDDQKGGEING